MDDFDLEMMEYESRRRAAEIFTGHGQEVTVKPPSGTGAELNQRLEPERDELREVQKTITSLNRGSLGYTPPQIVNPWEEPGTSPVNPWPHLRDALENKVYDRIQKLLLKRMSEAVRNPATLREVPMAKAQLTRRESASAGRHGDTTAELQKVIANPPDEEARQFARQLLAIQQEKKL
jgi:hypothetical protein